MKKIVIATKNKGKIREMRSAFGELPIELLSLDDLSENIPEAVEDGLTFMDNSLIKAKYYQKYTGIACLADDSGLEVDALGGEPGIYSARYLGEDTPYTVKNNDIIKRLEGVPDENRRDRKSVV